MLRGFFSAVIVLHHLGQQMHGVLLLPVCKHLGYLGAGIFFFLSGYGLQSQFQRREDYTKGFLRHRLGAVLIPYCVLMLLYWGLYAVLGDIWSLADVLNSFRLGDPIVSFSWYIVVIALFYPAFYIMMRICRKQKHRTVYLGLCWYVLFVAVCQHLDFGSWWYNTAHLLVLGMAFAAYQAPVLSFVKRHYILLLAGAWIGFLGFFLSSSPLAAAVPFLKLPLSLVRTSLFVIGIMLLLCKLSWRSPTAKALGRISQEIYLCQGLWFLVLRNDVIYLESDGWMCLLSVSGTLLTAYCLHACFQKIRL